MKLVPAAIARPIARQVLLAQKNSPTILLGAGIAGMVSSTVLACHATLKLEDVFNDIDSQKAEAARAKEYVDSGEAKEGTTYTDKEMQQDLRIIKSRGLLKIVKLYVPAVVVGAASIFALTKSHSILKDRNLALTAAYVAVDEAFKKYRRRVIEKYGEEEDRQLRYESEYVDIIDDETGKMVSSIRVTDDAASLYARWFDEESTCWNKHPEYNLLWLRQQQNWWNEVLRYRGHVFLNEVYGSLGLSHTKPGAIVGWVNGSGDGYVDFGIWDGQEQALDFFNGREGAILLDFNVDGVIYDKLDTKPEDTPWQM